MDSGALVFAQEWHDDLMVQGMMGMGMMVKMMLARRLEFLSPQYYILNPSSPQKKHLEEYPLLGGEVLRFTIGCL